MSLGYEKDSSTLDDRDWAIKLKWCTNDFKFFGGFVRSDCLYNSPSMVKNSHVEHNYLVGRLRWSHLNS